MVEVADDQVTATRLSVDPGAESPEPRTYQESGRTRWRELEVEILGGDRDQLAAVVGVLRAAGAKPASSASKLARALDAKNPPVTRKSKEAGPALLTMLAKLRDTLIRADRALREGTPDALHDARAVARRIRSVLAVYSPLFSSASTRQLRAELQQYGAVLGRARDLEVLKTRLAGQLVEEPEEYASAAAARIEAEFSSALPSALADVAELIRSDGYLEMLRKLDAFIADPPFSRRAEKPAAAELPTHLAARLAEPDLTG